MAPLSFIRKSAYPSPQKYILFNCNSIVYLVEQSTNACEVRSSVSSFCSAFLPLPPPSPFFFFNFPPPPPQSPESECENDGEGDQLEPVIQFPRQNSIGTHCWDIFFNFVRVYFINMWFFFMYALFWLIFFINSIQKIRWRPTFRYAFHDDPLVGLRVSWIDHGPPSFLPAHPPPLIIN